MANIRRYIPTQLRTECWEFKKKKRFVDVEVIGVIFYRGIQNVSSVQWRDRFIDGNADELTEGFKTSAPYGDMTDSPMKIPTESPTDSKWQHRMVRALFADRLADGFTDRIIRRGSRRQKLIYPLKLDPILPYFSFFFLISTLRPPKKKSPSSQHNKSYIFKSSCHSIRVLIYRRIFISFCK